MSSSQRFSAHSATDRVHRALTWRKEGSRELPFEYREWAGAAMLGYARVREM